MARIIKNPDDKTRQFLSIAIQVFASYPEPAEHREWALKIMAAFTQAQ